MTHPSPEARRILRTEFAIGDDRASGTITFHTNYSEPFEFTMSTAALDEMIGTLGTLRVNLHPDVPVECPPGERVATYDPHLFVDAAPNGQAIVNVRSLRFGWQHFQLPAQLARQT